MRTCQEDLISPRPPRETYRENTILRAVVAALTVAIVGALLLLWSNAEGFWQRKEVLQALVRDLGALLVA